VKWGEPSKTSTVEPVLMKEEKMMAKKLLCVMCVIVEPTAPAIAYGLHSMPFSSIGRLVLVFDLGGGTLDVEGALRCPLN
jgi:actin-like ATPase involved in cell morphogenesis